MDKHDLIHEFPELKEKIHELKVSDNHFRRLFDEYHEVAHGVRRIETDPLLGKFGGDGLGDRRVVPRPGSDEVHESGSANRDRRRRAVQGLEAEQVLPRVSGGSSVALGWGQEAFGDVKVNRSSRQAG